MPPKGNLVSSTGTIMQGAIRRGRRMVLHALPPYESVELTSYSTRLWLTHTVYDTMRTTMVDWA